MKAYQYISLREKPTLKLSAAKWFSDKWNIPIEAYLKCMDAYLNKENEYGWYICLDENKIVAGLGVIKNDFHKRKDLTPNICAVYTEEKYRKQKIASTLLDIAVEDLRKKGISPLYLVSDHTNFYERYGWEFVCMVEEEKGSYTRMYMHK